MKDTAFLQTMVARGRQAGAKVSKEFSNLTLEQLNWKPAPESWSIGQCLDHLIITDCLYFPAFKKIVEGKFKMTVWQRWSPLSGLFGKILVSQLEESGKRKVNTARIFVPSASKVDAEI